MRPDLRDYFAIHFASTLAKEQRYSLEFISGRAYDLADALLAERERRAESDLLVARDLDLDRDQWDAPANEATHETHREVPGALLDDPMMPWDADSAVEAELEDRQPSLDPRWLEPAYDPSWDADRFPMRSTETPGSERPGLSRTRGPATPAEQRADDARKRTA